jgi:hypothetical protein
VVVECRCSSKVSGKGVSLLSTVGVKTLKCVVVIVDIEDQDHFSEIADSVTKGYVVFNHIGAGQAVLSKEPIDLVYKDSASIIDYARFNKGSEPLSLLTVGGVSLEVFVSVVPDEAPIEVVK